MILSNNGEEENPSPQPPSINKQSDSINHQCTSLGPLNSSMSSSLRNKTFHEKYPNINFECSVVIHKLQH